MQGCIAYTKSVSAGGTEVDTTALSDPQMPIINGHFLPPTDLYLYYAVGVGVNMSRARLVSPSLRLPFIPYLWPLNTTTAANGVPDDANIADYRAHPFRLRMLEELECDTSQTDAGSQQMTVALFFGDNNMSTPSGLDTFSLRCTASITATPYAWTSGSLTLGQSIPQGEYSVVGLQCITATGIAARLIFPGDPTIGMWRPGCVTCPTAVSRPPFAGRKAQQGVLGKFRNTALPQLEVLCAAADTAQTVILDLMKTA